MSKREVNKCECGDHSFVSLTKGYVTIFDNEDAGLVSSSNWYADIKGHTVYARTNGNIEDQRLHRRIASPRDGYVVDHRSGDGLDNRKRNLREASLAENSINRRNGPISKSGYIGVFKSNKKWGSCIRKESGHYQVGIFETKIEAAIARDLAVLRDYGQFATLNFPALSRWWTA